MTKNKYGYVEKRVLHRDDLRNLCINKNWYTSGDSTEYVNMLNMCEKENITTDEIVEIATDIMSHSNDEDRSFESYAFEIVNICKTFIESI